MIAITILPRRQLEGRDIKPTSLCIIKDITLRPLKGALDHHHVGLVMVQPANVTAAIGSHCLFAKCFQKVE